MLEPPPVVAGHAQVGVEVKPVEVGVARPRGGHPRRIRLRSETPDPRTGIQQLVDEKVMFAPILVIAGLSGVGPRVEEPGIGLIAGYAFSAPFEEVKLKAR